MTGIRFALDSDWEKAVICILVAACFDMIDGLSARLLRAFSRFGAELDSLSDVISFGVAPSIIFFLWIKSSIHFNPLQDYELLGWYWIPFLFYTMCCAFRLARFNVMSQDEFDKPKIRKNYFLGVPSPAGAGLVLLPMSIEFVCAGFAFTFDILKYANFLLIWVSLIAVLMISSIPTFSLRNMRLNISRSKAMPFLVMVCLVVAVFIKEMWVTLLVFGMIYLLSLPFSYIAFRRDIRNDKKSL